MLSACLCDLLLVVPVRVIDICRFAISLAVCLFLCNRVSVVVCGWFGHTQHLEVCGCVWP